MAAVQRSQEPSTASVLWKAIKHPSLYPMIHGIMSQPEPPAATPEQLAALPDVGPPLVNLGPTEPTNKYARAIGQAIGGSIKSGVTAPHDVMTGQVPLFDEEGKPTQEAIGRTLDLAALAGGGSVAGTLERAAGTPGTDLRVLGQQVLKSETDRPGTMISNADQLRELANQRRARGWATGKSAAGWDFRRPDPEIGTPERAAAEARAAEQAAQPPAVSPLMTQEDKDFIEGGGFFSDTAKPGGAIAAAAHVPQYATGLETALDRIPSQTLTGAQWKNQLQRFGAKPEEMEYRGLGPALDTAANVKLPRSEIAQHLAETPVALNPIEKRAPPQWEELTPQQQGTIANMTDEYNQEHGLRGVDRRSPEDTYQSMVDYQDNLPAGFPKPAEYDQYQLPGGQNYRERLMQLPHDEPRFGLFHGDQRIAPEMEFGNGTDARTWALEARHGDALTEPRADIPVGTSVRQVNSPELFTKQQGSHWDEPNVLFHRRSTDREFPQPLAPEDQANNERLYAMESQIGDLRRQQGDVGMQIGRTAQPLEQARRAQIYQDMRAGRITGAEAQRRFDEPSEYPPEVTALQDRLQGLRAQEDLIRRNMPKQEIQPPTIRSLHDEENQSDWHQQGREKGYKKGGEAVAPPVDAVPDAPFKGSNWERLALHDQLREAAEKGYPRISWTAGEENPTNPMKMLRDRPQSMPQIPPERMAEIQKADKGIRDYYNRRRVDQANKIGKAHGVQVQRGALPDTGGINGYQAMDRLGIAPEDRDEFWRMLNYTPHEPMEVPSGDLAGQGVTRDQLFQAARDKGYPVYHMDIPDSLRRDLLTKPMSLFSDTGKAEAVAAAEHLPGERYANWQDARQGKAAETPTPLSQAEHNLTVNDILHPDTPAAKRGSRTVEDIAAGLDKRGQAALKELGVPGGKITEPTPEHNELLSRAMASEIQAAMGRGGETAVDWYRSKVENAMKIAEEMHPELKDDPHQRMGYTASLAITSQGVKVRPNVRLADQAYTHFKQTGRFPTNLTGAKSAPTMNQNFAKLNTLLDTLGPEGTREFLNKKFSVRELTQAGHEIDGENMDTMVHGSTILGPKIGGGFYQNLNGNFDPVTMDLWFMRGWGRLTGTLSGNPANMPKAAARLTNAMKDEGIKVPSNAKGLAQAADDIVRTHERDYAKNRAQYDSGEKQKSELTYAAERYQKNANGINEQPTSGGHREWIRKVVNRARDILQQHGVNMSNADMQATWWYPEKELYAKLGGRSKTEEINVDYATALRELADEKAGAGSAAGPVGTVEQRPGPAAKANVTAADAGLRGRGQKAAKTLRSDTAKGEAVAAAAHLPQAEFKSWQDALQGVRNVPESAGPAGGPATERGLGPESAHDVGGGAGGGDAGLRAAQAQAKNAAGAYEPLPALPQDALNVGGKPFIPGPIGKVKQVAESYMRDKTPPTYHKPPDRYYPLDKEHATNIAQAFHMMKHEPDNPAVKASYAQMIKETRDQYRHIRREHPDLQLIPNEAGHDPYAQTPRMAAQDVIENNRLHFFPTEQGYGTGEQGGIDLSSHPMLQPSGETLNGKPLLNNDLFRIVHDYFGHLKEGYGFRAAGEDNAWRSHAAMYSDLARPAMTTETRGQNSWVNHGPHAAENKGASGANTIYAEQKVGLMPEWTMRDRGSPEPIITYQGSPSAHAQIEMSKIGSGEGSGVRGHGQYAAEHEPIARWYRYQTATRRDPLLKKYGLTQDQGSNLGIDIANAKGDVAPLIEEMNDHIENLKAKIAGGDSSAMTANHLKDSQNMVRYMQDPKRATGHMYQLAIDRPQEHFLDWDKPLSQQSDYVRQKLQPMIEYMDKIYSANRATQLAKAKAGLAKSPSGIMNQKYEADIRRFSQPIDWENTPGSRLYEMSAHHALGRAPRNPDEGYPISSQYLRAKGLAGVQYESGTINKKFQGHRNYATFEAPRILKRYVIPGAIGAGAVGFGALARDQQNGT